MWVYTTQMLDLKTPTQVGGVTVPGADPRGEASGMPPHLKLEEKKCFA